MPLDHFFTFSTPKIVCDSITEPRLVKAVLDTVPEQFFIQYSHCKLSKQQLEGP